MSNSILLDYSSALKINREVFLLNYRTEFQAFEAILEKLIAAAATTAQKRDDQERSHLALYPLIAITERQGKNAFECLTRYQSYDAWLVFRPGLEAALVLGNTLVQERF